MNLFYSALDFFAILASPKLLSFGKLQINLHFLSLISNFAHKI